MALALDDVSPGLHVVHYWDGNEDVLEILSGPVDHTFTAADTRPMTVPAFEVKCLSDGNVHWRSTYFLGLAPDKGAWSGNHLTRA